MADPRFGQALEYQRQRQRYQTEYENKYKEYLMRAQAVPVPETEVKPSVLTRLGDVLQTGVYATAGAVSAVQAGESSVTGAWKGLTHQEKRTWSDVLRKAGVKESHAKVLGLAMDIVADPITYVPFGAVAKFTGVSRAARAGGRAALKLPYAKGLVKGVKGTFGVSDLPKTFQTEQWLAKHARELGEEEAVALAREISKKTPTSFDELVAGVTAGKLRGKLGKGAELYSESEVDFMINLIEQGKYKLTTKKLVNMGYDPVIITGMKRYKQAAEWLFKRERAAGVNVGFLEAYFPHVLKDPSIMPKEFMSKGIRGTKPAARFTKGRVVPTQEELRRLGFEVTDPRAAFAARALSSARVIEHKKFIDTVMIHKAKELGIVRQAGMIPGVAPDVLRSMAPGKMVNEINRLGYVQYTIESPFMTGKAHMRTFYAPKEIVDAIQRVETLYSDVPTTKAFEMAYDRLLNIWKGWATVVNPGFHFRNTYSNWFNMWLGGVNPAKLPGLVAKAVRIRSGGQGMVGNLPYDEVRQLIRQYGVHGKGWAAMQHFKDPQAIITDLFKQESFIRKAAPTKLGRWLGTNIEDNARIGMFVDGLEKGMSPLDSALRVKKHLFDYGELSQVERRYLRRLIPFYTWLRKNAPLQIEAVWKQTGKYALIPKFKEALEPEAAKGETKPPFFEELYAIRMPAGIQKLFGGKTPLYLNPNLPFQDLNRIFDPKDLLNSVGPWKAVAELALNKSIFTGAPLEVTPGELVHRDWMNYFKPAFDVFNFDPIVNEQGQPVPALSGKLVHMIETAFPFLRGGSAAAMAMGGMIPGVGLPGEPPMAAEKRKYRGISGLAGIKLMPHEEERRRRAEAYRVRDAYRAALKKARQIDPYVRSSMVR